MLALAGFAEPVVVVRGHPRFRARALAALEARRRRDRIVTASLGALVLVALLVLGAVRSPLMAVEEVAVIGLPAAQRDAVAAVLGVGPGTNVLDVDLATVADRAERLPWVATATARRRLPSTVEVRVAARPPVVVGTVGGTRYLLDADGTAVEAVRDGAAALSTADAGALPQVELAAAPAVGDLVADPGIRTAASVAGQMPAAVAAWITAYRVTSAGEVEADLRIPVTAGPVTAVARLGRPEAIAEKAAALAALVDEALARGMALHIVDVRIPDRPVLAS